LNFGKNSLNRNFSKLRTHPQHFFKGGGGKKGKVGGGKQKTAGGGEGPRIFWAGGGFGLGFGKGGKKQKKKTTESFVPGPFGNRQNKTGGLNFGCHTKKSSLRGGQNTRAKKKHKKKKAGPGSKRKRKKKREIRQKKGGNIF